MHFTDIVYFALLAAAPLFVTATPTPLTDQDVKGILESIKQEGVTYDFEHFNQKREEDGGVNSLNGVMPTNKLPSCKNDPSWVIPKKSNYTVDQGVRIFLNGKESGDYCSGGKGNDHCWTEQYWVESEIVYDEWQQTGYAVECAKTADCKTTTVQMTSSCVTHETHKDNSIAAGISASFDKKFLGVGYGIEVNTEYTHTWGTMDGRETCTQNEGSAECGWDDKDCHQVWQAQRNVKMYGYIARVCLGKGNGVQQNTKNKNGKWVRGQMDFSFTMPINKIVGCSALCGDQKYPNPPPQSQAGRVPFTRA